MTFDLENSRFGFGQIFELRSPQAQAHDGVTASTAGFFAGSGFIPPLSERQPLAARSLYLCISLFFSLSIRCSSSSLLARLLATGTFGLWLAVAVSYLEGEPAFVFYTLHYSALTPNPNNRTPFIAHKTNPA